MAETRIDYLDAFQIGTCVLAIVGLGALCSHFKMFNYKEAFSIRRTIYLIAMPGLIFREIGIHKLNYHDWQPFFNGILVQLTSHILIGIISFIGPFKNKLRKFMSLIYSTSYINFVFFGYPVVRVLFGDEYVHIPTLHNLVTLVFFIPIHTFISFHDNKQPSESSQEMEDELEEGIEKVTGGPIQPVNTQGTDENSKSENSQDGENSQKNRQKGDIENQQNSENESNDEEFSEEPVKAEETYEDDISDPLSMSSSENGKHSKKSRFSPRFWAVFWSIVTPCNICAILGIIWSAIDVKMPVFLNDFVYDLEKATLGAGLFTCGIFMYQHPFLGCSAVKLIITLACHFVILPLISLFWSWICKNDSKTSMINVIVHSMPTALIGYVMSLNTGHAMRTASFTFFYSILLSLPFLMLWVIVFNELDIFKDE
ncbi:Auxin Efflux Carrier family protein [Tritrichomonas foetus]|uniref:Auxin Efflux Carrier family protein n=1 Tax=Tritrichomonas foetus TaxID=1144522 RepID=A0A1J4JXE9_9EUKA|nr:Auxin Efflux Carrier family protein [Tritrichomonas foetus]|eukprot:OHT03338.1 Auxin Efflux Carrier family protein [Tritrichomonas foetus]